MSPDEPTYTQPAVISSSDLDAPFPVVVPANGPPPRSRHRSWCFTLNNYTNADCVSLDSISCTYVIYGKETAPTTGTRHLQGFITFSSGKTMRCVKSLLPGCHLSVARGTAAQNKVYCSKGGDVTERGTCPLSPADGGDCERSRWDAAWAHAIDGNYEAIDADIRIRSYTTIQKIRTDYMPPVVPNESTCGVWIFGLSGCGKTRSVLSAYPSCFIKPRNVWWDGYQNEPVVLMDDVDKFDRALGGKLKHWADFAPYIAEIKGSARRIRPAKFIVTSQYRIEDIWEDEETRSALLRRFVVIEKIAGQDIII